MSDKYIIQTNKNPKILSHTFSTTAQLNALYGSSNWIDVTASASSMTMPAHIKLTRKSKSTFQISLKTGVNGQQITGTRSVTVKSVSIVPAVPFLLKNVQIGQDNISDLQARIQQLEYTVSVPTKITQLA